MNFSLSAARKDAGKNQSQAKSGDWATLARGQQMPTREGLGRIRGHGDGTGLWKIKQRMGPADPEAGS
ncbi:MAG: hypothetical protein CMJ30_06285 [Phycisphaerae bacterium]|nr:hypothetical protein [Phycisphaerae bacterium]